MDKLKKIIILLVIGIVIMLMCILIIKANINANNENNKKNEEEYIGQYTDISQDFLKELGLVDDYVTYFTVENLLVNYMMKIEYSNKEAIYALTDDTYIKENQITQENILDKMSNISKYDSKLIIRKIYDRSNLENSEYYISCILGKNHMGKQYYFTMHKDEQNLTYSVEPIEKEEYDEKIKNSSNEIPSKRIIQNQYNRVIQIVPTEEEIANKYFKDFLVKALYYPEDIYNVLDSEYKEQCFPTLEDFKKYIELKREILETYDTNNLKSSTDFATIEEYRNYMNKVEILKLEKYQIRKESKYNKYVCIDSKGNHYTFYATSPFNYTVILGNYVIPGEDLLKEYNSSSDIEKVILNIKRFFMGIDDKNYYYSYNLLSESFKANKYPTKNDFIKYINQNFFEENELQYVEYREENNLFIYKIIIKDATGKSSKEKTFNIIMKLNEGTDFEMSFGEE